MRHSGCKNINLVAKSFKQVASKCLLHKAQATFSLQCLLAGGWFAFCRLCRKELQVVKWHCVDSLHNGIQEREWWLRLCRNPQLCTEFTRFFRGQKVDTQLPCRVHDWQGFCIKSETLLKPNIFWGELKKDENRKRIWKANLDPLRLFSFHSVQLRKLSGAKMDSTSTSRRSRTPSLFPCRSSPNSSDLRYRAFSRSPRRCFVLMPKQKLIASFRYNRKAVCEWLSLKKRKPHLSGKEKIGLRRSISRWYVYSPKPIHYEFLSFRTLFHGFPPTETTLPPTAPWCWTSQSHSVQWCRWTCQTDLRKRDGRTSPISQVQVSPLLNGWFIMETPIKMDNLGVPLFLETSKWLQQQKIPFFVCLSRLFF